MWNLVRVQRGRSYESFSGDGSRFSEPQPTTLVNSDSPAGLTRTDDGRLVLLWNNCQRYPYAFGGRQVLHAAVSEDEGKTWIGYREVKRDPKADEPPPPGGDFGTAYPFPVTANDGLVLFTSGQGAGRAAIVAFDPAWLYETEAHSDFQTGVGDWTFFGCKGVERVGHPSKVRVDGQASGTLPLNHTTAGANYLRIRSTAAKDPAGLLIESVDVRIARRR